MDEQKDGRIGSADPVLVNEAASASSPSRLRPVAHKIIPPELLRMPSEEEQDAWARSHYEPALPFCIENWTPEAQALSIPTEIVQLERVDVLALIDRYVANWDHRPVAAEFASTLAALEIRLDLLVAGFGHKAFVRLGSRSPKDYCGADYERGYVTSGAEAIMRLTGSMERIYDDLEAARRVGYLPTICIRKFLDLKPEHEFRCFVEERKLAGISQYVFFEHYPWIEANAARIKATAGDYLRRRLAPVVPQSSFTADLIIDESFDPILLELNPPWSSRRTDPCLFRGTDLDGGFRWVPAQGIEAGTADTVADGIGAQHKSPVAAGEAPNISQES